MHSLPAKEISSVRQLLGAVLQEEGKIDQTQLAEAMRIKSRERLPLGQILVRLGHVTEEDVARAVAKGAGLAYVNLDELSMDPKAMELLPESLARRHGVLPLAMDEETLHVAVASPLSIQVRKLLERGARRRIKEHVALAGKLKEHVERIYERGILESSADAGAAEIVATFIERAIRLKASDIHLEALEDSGRLRFRVDGMLREVERFPTTLMPSLVSRIKVMAGMDIADTRQPQDGAFQQQGGARPMDVRVSTLPSIHGEKVVMRLLASSGQRLTLSDIGLSQANCDTFQELIRRPHGIILIVGPTGSGKSTTLTAALTTINTVDINITTVEEPVEYKLDGITQVHVGHNSKISFAAALRTILRQDPDVIMVGEVRDTETAEIALRAALTGHLVFTTLHTNDAPSALPRLVDMGCEPFLVASSVTCVLAQRLVRVLCPRCREAYVPEPALLDQLEVAPEPDLHWYKPVGCPLCQKIGYRGRTGVFEMMVVDAAIRAATMRGESAEALRALALEAGMRTMRQDALPRLATGQTSVQEVLRVTVAG
ncbi:GspE/PulE family protein [Megalodesulfovibrio paquesii]